MHDKFNIYSDIVNDISFSLNLSLSSSIFVSIGIASEYTVFASFGLLTCTLIAFQKCHVVNQLRVSTSPYLLVYCASFGLTWQRNIMAFRLMILVRLDVSVMNVKAVRK